MSERATYLVVSALGLCSCGKDGGGADAGLPPPPPGCDYGELADEINDDIQSNVNEAETTHLALTTQAVFCGTIDNTHFDANTRVIDVDSFKLDVAADTKVIVQLQAAGAEQLGDVEIAVFERGAAGTVGTGKFLGNHAVFNATLPTGFYEVTVFAANTATPAQPIGYKVTVSVDDPATRCGKIAAAANFTEANDGAGSINNDMVDVRYVQNGTMNRALTVATTDVPEPTAITTAAGTKYRLTGTLADVNAADEYRDRDAYLITTGADTNQLSIRLNWPGMKADLDYMLFNENKVPEIADGFLISPMEDEFQTFSVQPSTNYWLWVGAFDSIDNLTPPTPPMLPLIYDFSICAESFTPST